MHYVPHAGAKHGVRILRQAQDEGKVDSAFINAANGIAC
jgi:hypothetical protein